LVLTVFQHHPTIRTGYLGTRQIVGVFAIMAKSDDQEPEALAAASEFSEEEFKARLREMGRLREPAGNAPTPEGEFTPVEVRGKPLSDSVVEDRR
jgi:hypothetical protein